MTTSNGGLTCLFCARPLTDESAAQEHVIPNCLGGRLKTRRATCGDCNSRAGASFEAEMAKALSFLANALDVPRDRGQHPVAKVRDSDSGLEYIVKPGRAPVLASNVQVERDGNGILFRGFARSPEEAEEEIRRLIKRSTGNRKRLTDLTVTTEQAPARPYAFDLEAFSFRSRTNRRAIAKMALCYAREMQVPVSTNATVVRFLRGEDVAWCPVVPVLSDVIAFEPPEENALAHEIFLLRAAEDRCLFGYVVLFGVVEFLVLLDCDSVRGALAEGYRYDLVTGSQDVRPFRRVARSSAMHDWFLRDEFPAARINERSKALTYWLKHRNELWMRRALGAAGRRLYATLDAGGDREAAVAAANSEAERVLSRYGLTIGKFELSPVPGVS
ncbi:MAG: HNH endonuclease [Lentisphaerae bacterium]|jgi:hypothetical protein|nr:HNH endonuclease [Lentisphaerota bacterium]MBT4821829.1 HNH endonuclease [Lentisphaerota bacterium]MBT7059107.1 HNH endonuclease [Lentisphaerota bacterium]